MIQLYNYKTFNIQILTNLKKNSLQSYQFFLIVQIHKINSLVIFKTIVVCHGNLFYLKYKRNLNNLKFVHILFKKSPLEQLLTLSPV